MRSFLSLLAKKQNFAHFVSICLFRDFTKPLFACFFTSAADLVQLQAHAMSKARPLTVLGLSRRLLLRCGEAASRKWRVTCCC